MKLSELLAEIGDDNLQFQTLNECLDGNQSVNKKRVTRFTFLTNESLVPVIEGKRRGLVVWIDEDKLQAAAQRLRERAAKKDGDTHTRDVAP